MGKCPYDRIQSIGMRSPGIRQQNGWICDSINGRDKMDNRSPWCESNLNRKAGGMMNINIRNEQPEDYRSVEEIAREAFWNLCFLGGHEHYVVHKMRSHPDYIKELSFVIEVDGEIAGGTFYTRSKIVSEDRKEYKTISFGPVFIAPELHRKGLGKELIAHSIEAASTMLDE